MAVLRVSGLGGGALAAAAEFYARILPQLRGAAAGADHLTLVLPLADHTHRHWRAAALASLARDFAPVRVNAVAGEDEAGIAAALHWLAAAPGVTGQVLVVDGQGAGPVVSLDK